MKLFISIINTPVQIADRCYKSLILKINTPYQDNVFGRKLKSFRQKNNWNQSQFAEKLGISIPAYSKLETGITDPNLSRIGQVAELLEVSFIELVTEEANHDLLNELEELKLELERRNLDIVRLQAKVIALYDERIVNTIEP